ncbi:Large ribosomal subunit protein [Trichinella pseudospiralis]
MMNRRTVIEEEKRSSSGNELFKQCCLFKRAKREEKQLKRVQRRQFRQFQESKQLQEPLRSTGRSKVVSMTIVHAGRQLTTTTPSPTLQHYNKRRQLCILKLKGE